MLSNKLRKFKKNIKERLPKSCCIFSDDTNNPYEKEILLLCNIYLEGNIRYHKVYSTITQGNNFSTNPLSH